ncbi:MAG TPA: thermonuclease family protein [Ilumatobacteraceae bacterium]
MRRVVLSVAVLLTACGASTATTPTTPTALEQNATMLSVVDGDTIDVDIGGHRERVRLIGIDTPETKKPNTPIQCFGPEATKFTKSLLPHDTPLHLERDVVARDDFGRMLAYVYLAADGTFVNMSIISHGFARVLTIRPNAAHADEFVAAAQAAQTADIGLWASCAG